MCEARETGTAADPPDGEAACYIHRGIGGVEFFDFPETALAWVERARRELTGKGYRRVSLHAPMPRPAGYTLDGVACFFLNEDPDRRELSFHIVEECLRAAQRWEAVHVVTHLTYGLTDTRDSVTARRLAHTACARLAQLARQYRTPVHIEFAAYTDAFHAPAQFIEAIAPHPELAICLDVGHAGIGAGLRRRDYLADITALAPHTRSLHLWNTRGTDGTHVPLHPSQSPAAGWLDIKRTLEIVLRRRADAAIVFEYPVTEITAEIQAGYDWIARLVTSPAAAAAPLSSAREVP